MTRRVGLFGALLAAIFLLSVASPARAVDVMRVKSPGGIEAWLIRDTLNPILSLRFVFRGGAALDPAGKEGLARMAVSLLDEGAGDMSVESFRGALEDRAIGLSFDASFDEINGSLQTLTEHRDTAVRLLALAMTQPRFDDDAVQRVRSQILARIRRDSENPDVIAQTRLFAELFPQHPYGRRTRGTPDSIAAIDTEAMREFVRERLARDNLIVGAAGDVTPDELGRLLDAAFGALPARAAEAFVKDIEPTLSARTIVVKTEVPQSAIAFAGPGLKRDDPDFYVALVLNHILGGSGFTSRLHQEIREKRGLAYSAGTSLHPLRHAALIIGGAGTANPRAKETVGLIHAEWKRMAEGGVRAEELEDAKTYLTGSFPLRLTQLGTIAAILAAMQQDNLGVDYLDRRNDHIRAVTAESIARVARRLLDPARLLVVVAGEPDGL